MNEVLTSLKLNLSKKLVESYVVMRTYLRAGEEGVQSTCSPAAKSTNKVDR